MKKRKRAPGAGRKPGEWGQKRATLSLRLTEAMRADLAAAATKRHRSLSEEIGFRLHSTLVRDRGEAARPDHLRALAALAQLAAEKIEQITGASWLADPFTAEATCHMIEQVLIHFAPPRLASHAIPDQIEKMAAIMPKEIAEAYRRPAALALMQATGLIAWIESAYRAEPPTEWSDPWDPTTFRRQLFRDLVQKRGMK
jgi:hypothetical protein